MAEQIGVDATSVYNWERNSGEPRLKCMPARIAFLGYNPLPAANTLAGRLVRHRTTLGLSQEESAKDLTVDPTTIARWERGEREPTGVFLGRVKRFLSEREAEPSEFRRVG